MTKISYKTILKKAETCHTNVKKKYKNGISSKWGYYICKSILNPGKDITKISIGDAPNPEGDKINKTVKKNDYLKIIKKYVQFIEHEKRLPNWVAIGGTKVSPRLFTAFVAFILYKKLPKTQAIKSSIYSKPVTKCSNPYTSSPHYTSEGCNHLGQCTPYYCGPHCVHQGFRKFRVNISESTLASWAGTTTSGTDHQGLETAIKKAAKKAGFDVDIKWYNFSDLGKTVTQRFKKYGEMICKSNVFGFFHIGYEDSGEERGDKVFGHYEMVDKVDIKNKQVRVLNSLGSKCGGNSYCGHLQWRSFALQAHFISNISQKSVCIVTKK